MDDEQLKLAGTDAEKPPLGLPEKVRERLNAPLPDAAISKREGAGGRLSAIGQIWIVERLNDVFGIGGWSFDDRIIDHPKKEDWVIARVTLTFWCEGHKYTVTQYGGQRLKPYNDEDVDPGDRYKGAVTDGMTKCASYLEIGIQVYKNEKKVVVTDGNNTSDELDELLG